MKLFQEEIKKFYNKLCNKENFSLARFGDGEMLAMRGDTIASGCGEWNTNGALPQYEIARNLLREAFTYQDPGYHVGIVCPCCQGEDNFKKMVVESGQPMSNLTFANIFVNGNYDFFVDKYITLFKEREIVLVANEKSQVNRLPFSGMLYPVKYDAWVVNQPLIEVLKNETWCKNKVFLFACGPLGKILACELWKVNKENTYLDIGSTLHPWLQSDINIRSYYKPGSVKQICSWGKYNAE